MRRLRTFQPSAQNICIFCLYRPVPTPRASTPRRFHAFAPGLQQATRKQHEGPVFDGSDNAGFGALGDEVEEIQTPTPAQTTAEQKPPRIRKWNNRERPPVRKTRDYPGDGTLSSMENQLDAGKMARWLLVGTQNLPGGSARLKSQERDGTRQPSVMQAPDAAALKDSSVPMKPRSSRSWKPLDLNFGLDHSTLPRGSARSGSQESDGTRQPPVMQAPDAAALEDSSVPLKPRSSRIRRPLDLKFGRDHSAPEKYAPLDPRIVPDHNRMQGRIGNPKQAISKPLELPHSQQTVEELDEYGMPTSESSSTTLPRSQLLHEELDEYGMPTTSSANTGQRKFVDRNQDSRDNDAEDSNRRRRSTRKIYEEKEDDRSGKRRAARREREEEDPDFDRSEYHRRKRERQRQRAAQEARDAETRELKIPDFISIGQLATEMNIRYGRFAEVLQKFGFDETNSDYILNAEDAAMIAEEAGFISITESADQEDLFAAPLPENLSELPQRPPVVTIMGHVDHGKTTILDYMRKSSIVASEHGGITQHIGAFSVPMPSGKVITFLDTPGHAAFLSMRQRGATVTDIVVLVVAADDSVMPQTLEALKHANAAKVPIIVALNKVDKPEAKPEQVKQDLARHGVEIEDFGGDVQVVPVSGKTGQGMQDLEEAIIALSEIQDQRAPTDGNVEGWVLESSTKEVGKVATALIRRGTLRLGDIILAGTEFCRVRMMRDEFGNQISSAGPGTPVEVVGWRGQPNAGDELLQARDEQHAHRVISVREANVARAELGKDVDAINDTRRSQQIRHERDIALKKARRQNLEIPEDTTLAGDVGTDQHGPRPIYFIVKGDVAGSVEAVVNAISALANADVQPVILHSGVGPVSESNVDHATAAGGYVVSFNLPLPAPIRALAERANTNVIEDNVIYRLIDSVKGAVEEILPPVTKSKALGEAEILQIFDIQVKGKKVQKVAGCRVRNGNIVKSARVRITRGKDNEVIWTGNLSSLKNVKKNVAEMSKGSECGMSFEAWETFEVGDVVQCFEEWEEKRRL